MPTAKPNRPSTLEGQGTEGSVTRLEEEDAYRLAALIADPPAPNDALLRAARAYADVMAGREGVASAPRSPLPAPRSPLTGRR